MSAKMFQVDTSENIFLEMPKIRSKCKLKSLWCCRSSTTKLRFNHHGPVGEKASIPSKEILVVSSPSHSPAQSLVHPPLDGIGKSSFAYISNERFHLLAKKLLTKHYKGKDLPCSDR